MIISTLVNSQHKLDNYCAMLSSRASERSGSQNRSRGSYRDLREVGGEYLHVTGGHTSMYLHSESLIAISTHRVASHSGVPVAVVLEDVAYNTIHLFSHALQNDKITNFLRRHVKDSYVSYAKFTADEKEKMYQLVRNVAGGDRVSKPPVLDDVVRFLKGLGGEGAGDDQGGVAIVGMPDRAGDDGGDSGGAGRAAGGDAGGAVGAALRVAGTARGGDWMDADGAGGGGVLDVHGTVERTLSHAAAADVAPVWVDDDVESSHSSSVGKPSFTRRCVAMQGDRFYAGLPSVLYGGDVVWAGALLRLLRDCKRDSARPWTTPPPAAGVVGCLLFQLIATSQTGSLSMLVRPPRLTHALITAQNWAPETNSASGYTGMGDGGSGANSPPGTLRISSADVADVVTWSSKVEAAALWRKAFTRPDAPAPPVRRAAGRPVARRPTSTEAVHRRQHEPRPPLPPPAVRSCVVQDSLTHLELGAMLMSAVRVGLSPRGGESGVDTAWVSSLIRDVHDVMVVDSVGRVITAATGATSRSTLQRVLSRFDVQAIMREITSQIPAPTMLVISCCEDVLQSLSGK